MTPTAPPRADPPRGNKQAQSDPDKVSRAALVDALVAEDATPAQRRLYRSIIDTVAGLSADHAEVIDLKVADSALAEMAEAFRVFKPFRDQLKVTIFRSAPTHPDHP